MNVILQKTKNDTFLKGRSYGHPIVLIFHHLHIGLIPCLAFPDNFFRYILECGIQWSNVETLFMIFSQKIVSGCVSRASALLLFKYSSTTLSCEIPFKCTVLITIAIELILFSLFQDAQYVLVSAVILSDYKFR